MCVNVREKMESASVCIRVRERARGRERLQEYIGLRTYDRETERLRQTDRQTDIMRGRRNTRQRES